jgi:peptidoglycan/LPS O-acetylase OafA/YrhL
MLIRCKLDGWASNFFLSFLITGILIDMKARLAGSAYFIKFYGRRFLRIFPLYYFYLLVMTLAVKWMDSIGFMPKYMELFHDQVPYAVTYVYNFYSASAYLQQYTNFLTHFWSLAVEEQFYLLWPLLILLVPQKKYKGVFILIVVLSALFRGWVLLWDASAIPVFFTKDLPIIINVLPFSHLDAFALGALLTVTGLARAREQVLAILVGLPLLGILVDWAALGNLEISTSFGYPIFLRLGYKAFWGYTALNYLFTILIYGVARQGWFVRVLESRPMAYLGKISYGLYVYHFPIQWFVTVPFGISVAAPFSLFTLLISLGLTVAVASLSYHFLERPLIDLKDRFFPVSATRLEADPGPSA